MAALGSDPLQCVGMYCRQAGGACMMSCIVRMPLGSDDGLAMSACSWLLRVEEACSVLKLKSVQGLRLG